MADLYLRRFGVALDPETEVITTIGAKEGFSHLMWVLLQPGDAALVPSPSYPIHIWGPLLRRRRRAGDPDRPPTSDFFENVIGGYEYSLAEAAGHRAVVPAQPDHRRASTSTSSSGWSTSPASSDVVVVHDYAYAELGFDGYEPPSILQAEGAKECAVELYSMTKSFSMAGWRVAFLVGNAEVVAALAKLKSYLDYGTFQPIQIAATVTLNEAPEYPKRGAARSTRAGATRCATASTASAGRSSRPQGTMFAWAPIPEPYREMGSIEFAKLLVTRGARRRLARRRLRSRRRRPRALRPHRERAAHRPGRPQPPQGPDQAGLTLGRRIRVRFGSSRAIGSLAGLVGRTDGWGRRWGVGWRARVHPGWREVHTDFGFEGISMGTSVRCEIGQDT